MIRNAREGIVVSMGSPDTIIENNRIENTADIPNAAGINILNGPGTIIKGNTIRQNTAEHYWGILLEHDNGDTNAGGIGAGDPENVQILNNTITGNSNGIQLKAGRNIKLSGNALDNIGENFTAAPGVTYTDLTVGLSTARRPRRMETLLRLSLGESNYRH